MKKSPKQSKSKPKFNVIIIYGTVAVGKYTVADVLHKLINYKFFHNHHTHDLARQLFQRGNLHGNRIIENTRLLVFKEIIKAKINVVTTHTYSSDYVSLTGLTDPKYMKKLESLVEKNGGRIHFVHLIADEKEILKRISGKSRRNFHKLKDKKILKEILRTQNWKTIAPVKNNIQINNTKLSPQKVATMIIKHFKIKQK